MHYILYNSKSNNQNNEDLINNIVEKLEGNVRKISIFDIPSYPDFFNKLVETDDVTIIGGDGTLNHFVNDIKDYDLKVKVYYGAGGTGNDFKNDMIDKVDETGRILINDLVKKLPTVYVNGIEKKYINGIGYGIDGYACETADKIIAKHPQKKINYASISIKGLLFHYKRPNAEVIIDGKTYNFKKVYLASTMKGRYYGGGMKVAPDQNRQDENGKLTVVVMCNKSRIVTLMNFPKIFKGEHVKNKKLVHVFEASKEVEIRFNIPTALQIDGETVLDVYSYKVKL